MAASPPSEDQRNQQVTAAEILAGVLGSFLRSPEDACSFSWDDVFLPHLEEVIAKTPFSLSGAYFDAIRYALQFCSPRVFRPLTQWLVDKIGTSLWQPTSSTDHDVDTSGATSQSSISGSAHGTESFTAQSKWLYLFTAVLVEMDENEADSLSRENWYTKHLVQGVREEVEKGSVNEELESSWHLVFEDLLPRLTAALGHPFDSCRDHISRCLFRICYCHRKRERINASRDPDRFSSFQDASESNIDPGSIIVDKLATLADGDNWSFNDRYNALSTARRFIAYSVHLGEAKFEYSDYVIPLLPLAFEAIKSTVEEEINSGNGESNPEEDAAKRALEAEVIKAYRYTTAEVSVTAVISYGSESDITRVLDVVDKACKHEKWQVRQAGTHFLRCFQGAHKFLFTSHHALRTMQIVADLLADERREVSSAAMAALTGIFAASSSEDVNEMVKKYALIAEKSTMKRPKRGAGAKAKAQESKGGAPNEKERKRAQNQKMSVFFLCAAIMAQPYDTPTYVPVALAAISKHSFERNAPLGVRDIVKKTCAEYKRTHMSDNWDVHRLAFSQEQLEALEDVVSSPHYYA
jgi:proteasome activator subunit 4